MTNTPDQDNERYSLTFELAHDLMIRGWHCDFPKEADLREWLSQQSITPRPAPADAVTEAAVRALASAVMHHWPTAGKVFASDASISCLCGVSFFGFNPIGQWLVHVFGAEEYLLDAGASEVRG